MGEATARVELIARLRPAIAYAQRHHAGQRRPDDDAPFIVHPLEVASLLHTAGAAFDVIAAGLLHDTLEKTDATPDELRERFGPAVAAIVDAVTEDERIADYRERKAALRRQVAAAGREAQMVFAADKISKLRELGRHGSPRSSSGGAAPLPLRLDHYARCLALVEENLDDALLVGWLRLELGRLTAATALAGAA